VSVPIVAPYLNEISRKISLPREIFLESNILGKIIIYKILANVIFAIAY